MIGTARTCVAISALFIATGLVATPAAANPEAEVVRLLTLSEAQRASKAPPLKENLGADCFQVAALLCEATFTPRNYSVAKPFPGSVSFLQYANLSDAQAAFAKKMNDRMKPVNDKVEPGDPPAAKPTVLTKSESRITVRAGETLAFTDGLVGSTIVSIQCQVNTMPKKSQVAKMRKQLTQCLNGAFNAQVAKLQAG
jgi:hypothetical protein